MLHVSWVRARPRPGIADPIALIEIRAEQAADIQDDIQERPPCPR